MRWLDGITASMDISLRKLLERLKDREPGLLQSMGLQESDTTLATEQQQQMSNKFHFYPQYFIFNYKILKNMWQNVNNFRWGEYGCLVLSLTCVLNNFFKNVLCF